MSLPVPGPMVRPGGSGGGGMWSVTWSVVGGVVCYTLHGPSPIPWGRGCGSLHGPSKGGLWSDTP